MLDVDVVASLIDAVLAEVGVLAVVGLLKLGRRFGELRMLEEVVLE